MTKRTSSKGVEDRILRNYYKWLKTKRWDTNYHHMPNELPAYDDKMKRFASMLKLKGKKPGFADIMILEQHNGYGGLFIELKTETGSPSFEQLVFVHNANNNGYIGCVAYGFDAVKKITKWYMTNSTDPMPVVETTVTRNKIKFNVLEVRK